MDLFIEGQKITLSFRKPSKMVEITCEVEKVFDDRLALILPKYFMRYIECLQVHQKATAKAFSKFGTLDFNTVIISSPMEENFLIELDYNAIRLTSSEDMPFVRAVETMEIIFDKNLVTFKTFEISANYIKFYSDRFLNIGQILDCALILPKDYGIINFKGKVIEVDDIYDNEYKIIYETMTEEARQTLLYYMYLYTNDSD